jgi:hypothetical protein
MVLEEDVDLRIHLADFCEDLRERSVHPLAQRLKAIGNGQQDTVIIVEQSFDPA